DAATLAAREADGRGYTRPELAVLLAYSKMDLYGRLLTSDLPADPEFADWLPGYFPAALQERFGEHIRNHPLGREITATLFTNRIVDLLGSAFVFRLAEETGTTAAEVSRSALRAFRELDADGFSEGVFALDNAVPADRSEEHTSELQSRFDLVCR